jgi:hypothetical protein
VLVYLATPAKAHCFSAQAVETQSQKRSQEANKHIVGLRPGSRTAAGLYSTSTRSQVRTTTLQGVLGRKHTPQPSDFPG